MRGNISRCTEGKIGVENDLITHSLNLVGFGQPHNSSRIKVLTLVVLAEVNMRYEDGMGG